MSAHITNPLKITILLMFLCGCTLGKTPTITSDLENCQTTVQPEDDCTSPKFTPANLNPQAQETADESTGISKEEDAQIQPSPPTSVAAQVENGGIQLTWLGTGDDRVQVYRIYRKDNQESKWELLETFTEVEENTGCFIFMDPTIEPNQVYIYGVAAFDSYSNESEIAESNCVSIRGE